MNEYGTWSDWIWNEDYQKYYRQRQKPDGLSQRSSRLCVSRILLTCIGQYDFEWHGQASVVDAAQTPRDTSLEDDLAQTLSETHIHSPSANYDNQSTSSAAGQQISSRPPPISSDGSRANKCLEQIPSTPSQAVRGDPEPSRRPRVNQKGPKGKPRRPTTMTRIRNERPGTVVVLRANLFTMRQISDVSRGQPLV